MRRSRLIAYLIALVALLTGALLFTTPGADADTANPEIAFEGWFARSKAPAAQVDIPCQIQTLKPDQGCGLTGLPAYPTPQSKATGAYVVSSAGGDAGVQSNTGGDTGWAAFQWDIFDQFGATADKFVVTLTQGVDNSSRNNGDTWQPGDQIFIQACNILEGWASEPGSNPWDARPNASTSCVVPTVGAVGSPSARQFTFDVTAFAQSWLDGTGFGFVVKPGTPNKKDGLSPFQITFSGYYETTATATKPKVTFEFTPAVEEDFGGGDDFGFGDFGTGDDDFFEEITTEDTDGIFAALPDLDVIPTDVGSEPLSEFTEGGPAGYEAALPVQRPRTRPAGSDTGFPLITWLLLPLVLVAFWGTGTALGPLGDPVSARQGGVSRVLAARQATHHTHSFETTR